VVIKLDVVFVVFSGKQTSNQPPNKVGAVEPGHGHFCSPLIGWTGPLTGALGRHREFHAVRK
jgi:hypothetical protein